MSALGALPRRVEIVEVGPRDGLQNEAGIVQTADKVRFIEMLADSGLRRIEATSFVSPRAIPQLADAGDVMAAIRRSPGVEYSALVPNIRGMQRAIESGLRSAAVFTGATDSFTQHNINMTIEESIAAFRPVTEHARRERIRMRGYVSVCFGCPYEGAVSPAAVHSVCERLLDLGVTELSLGDTIGVATPNQVEEVAGPIIELAGAEQVALHFHDTRGAALANVLAGLLLGVSVYDSSAGGLGGCPYAPGASGNVATEDLLYMLAGMGIETGVDIHKVAAASRYLLERLGRRPPSKYLQAEE